MNKYDDIKTLLLTNMDIKKSCEFLFNYLKNYCFKPYHREKIDSYYNHLPDILKKLLYISNENIINSQNSKNNPSLMQILNAKTSNFEEFDILLNLFLAPINIENEMNIFSSIFHHNYGNTKFLFPITNSKNSNKMILYYLNQNQIDMIYNNFNIFKILSFSQEENIKKYLLKKELILTIREYYIFIILNFIKKCNNINKINIKDYYPNFKTYLDYISEDKFFSKKTEFIINNFDKERSLTFNFYSIMFLDFILYLHFSNNVQNQRLLEILTFSIEFLWLGEFVLSPQNKYYMNSGKNKLNPDSQNFTNSFIINSNNYQNYDRNFDIFNNSIFTNLNIPNLLVLNCLKNLINILQSKNYLFTEAVINGDKVCILKSNILLFSLQNSLYNFFKHGFMKYSNQEMNNTEISLCDFSSVWYAYICPWESLFNDDYFIDKKNHSKEKNFGFFSWSYSRNSDNETNNITPYFYNTFSCKRNTSPLKKLFNYNFLDYKQKSDTYQYSEYVEINIHFYTDLLQDYLKAFISCNILSLDEISTLINVLDLYSISGTGSFINDLMNFLLLREFSNGNINVNFSLNKHFY